MMLGPLSDRLSRADDQVKALMTADGKPPAAGQLQRNPDLAATFRRLAEHGAAKGERALPAPCTPPTVHRVALLPTVFSRI